MKFSHFFLVWNQTFLFKSFELNSVLLISKNVEALHDNTKKSFQNMIYLPLIILQSKEELF